MFEFDSRVGDVMTTELLIVEQNEKVCAASPAMRYEMPRSGARADGRQAASFIALAFISWSCTQAVHDRPAAAPEAPVVTPEVMLQGSSRVAMTGEQPREQPRAGEAPVRGRSSNDASSGARRSSVDWLELTGVGRGERVADLGPGYSDSLERMAAAVGPAGVVYSRHDPRTLTALPSDPGRPASRTGSLPANVVLMETPREVPFSAAAKHLNLVTLLFGYHDFEARESDRRRLNEAVFRVLEPGGVYVIAERAAPASAPPAERAHAIDERQVRDEVEAAGFRFVQAADLLSNDATRSAGSARLAGDRYLLEFEKPRGQR